MNSDIIYIHDDITPNKEHMGNIIVTSPLNRTTCMHIKQGKESKAKAKADSEKKTLSCLGRDSNP